jgi:hypothetical protein
LGLLDPYFSGIFLGCCSPNCPKLTSLQVAQCLGWFCTLSAIFGHNINNNNLQFSIIQKKNEAIVLQRFIHIFGMTGINFQNLWQIPKSN